MKTKTIMVAMVATILLAAMVTAEAKTKFEFDVFGGLRFGGSFHHGGYQYDAYGAYILEQLDVKPAAQFGSRFGISLGEPSWTGAGPMFELLFNYQGSDLRFEPESMSAVPDSITDRFEIDGDKIILGELDVMYVHGGVMYKFGSNSGWNPHVNVGLGATIFKAPDGDLEETKFSLSLGGGVTKMFNETLGGRLQMRGYFTSLPTDEYWVDYYGNVWATDASNMFFQGEISAGVVIAF